MEGELIIGRGLILRNRLEPAPMDHCALAPATILWTGEDGAGGGPA